MTRNRRRLAAAVLATAALLVGGTTIAAAAGGSKTTKAAAKATAAAKGGGARHVLGDPLAAAATYLGMTQAELRTALGSGKTLADVASATSGKSTAGLIAALVADAKSKLAAAVTAGTVTQAQADAISADLQSHVTDMVNNGPRAGGHGHGGPGGPGHLDAAATYLGVTAAALRAQLESGKTLAEVAAATSGKTTAGLIAA